MFDVRTTTRLPAWFSFAALRSLFSRFNSSLILFLDARRNIFYSESVISCRLPDFLNIAVSKLVSIRDGLGACVADDFVWSVCASYIVSTSAAPFFFFISTKHNRRVLRSRSRLFFRFLNHGARRSDFFRIIIFPKCGEIII